MPGGRVHKGESLEETLKREVQEEVGPITLESPHLLLTFPTQLCLPMSKGNFGLIFSVYFSTLSHSFTPILSPEHTDFQWFSHEELISLFKERFPEAFIEALESRRQTQCLK